MKIKRTWSEILDFPDEMPWEDAAVLMSNGELPEDGEMVLVENGVEDDEYDDEEE